MTLLMEKAGMSKTYENTEPAYSQEKRRNDRNRGRNRYSTCKDRCGEWSWTGGDDYS